MNYKYERETIKHNSSNVIITTNVKKTTINKQITFLLFGFMLLFNQVSGLTFIQQFVLIF